MYKTTDLLKSVQIRGLLPLANADLTGSNLLMFATEELYNDIVPTINSAREDFYTTYTDYPVPGSPDIEIPIPERAIGAKLRNVQLVSGDSVTELARRQVEDLPTANLGYYLQGNAIHLLTRFGPGYPTLRLYWFMRPNSLVTTDETAVITAVSGNSLTLDTIPAGFTDGALYDVVSARPNFSTWVWDATGTFFGGNIVLTGGTQSPGPASDNTLSNVRVGDVVSLAGRSSVVQVPVEFQSVLAQSVIVKALEATGDKDGMVLAQKKLDVARANALKLIGVRTESSPIYIVPSYSPARNWY